jgi:predicted nucleic acid-binding protein
MILLDTNIVSAIMAPGPPRAVIEWLNGQDTITLYLSTVTLAEIGYGLWVLPEGRRRRSLEDRFEKFVAEGFRHRI